MQTERNFENFWDIIRGINKFYQKLTVAYVFATVTYYFHRFEFKSKFQCFAKSNPTFSRTQTKKVFSDFGPIISCIFGQFVKTKCHTFSRMTLKLCCYFSCLNSCQIQALFLPAIGLGKRGALNIVPKQGHYQNKWVEENTGADFPLQTVPEKGLVNMLKVIFHQN